MFALQMGMGTRWEGWSVVLMDVLHMVDKAGPLRLHKISVAVWGGSCRPVQVVDDGRPPQLNRLTLPVFGSRIQCLPQTWITRMTISSDV